MRVGRHGEGSSSERVLEISCQEQRWPLLAVSDAVQGGSLERMLSYPKVGPLGVCCVVGASASAYVRKQVVRTVDRSATSTFRRLYLLSGSRAYLEGPRTTLLQILLCLWL